MKDLTSGSIARHLLRIGAAMGVGMLVQNLYVLVDLYFVAGLGAQSMAGVGAAATAIFFVSSLTQGLGVGTLALVSQASGRKDRTSANLTFNQSFSLALACGAVMLVVGFTLSATYMRAVAADASTRAAGTTYLHWYSPGLALQFLMLSMTSALRGTGIVRPTMNGQLMSVAVKIILAPILIAGWGTGHPLGVVGAALATLIGVATNVAWIAPYFVWGDRFVSFDWRLWKPMGAIWRRIVAIGWPSGAESAFNFAYLGVVYWAIRDFGSAAQAGFGIGLRILQSLYLPAFAVAFAATPVAGQNYGAHQSERVRATFRSAALMGAVLMAALTLLCQVVPAPLMRIFTHDAQMIAVGADFLRIVAWNLVPYGLVWTCAGHFQALGNTVPSLLSMTSRLVTFVTPAAWLSSRAGFQIEQLWYLWVASVALQAVLSIALLRSEFHRKLTFTTP